jgi:hypothetical protein
MFPHVSANGGGRVEDIAASSTACIAFYNFSKDTLNLTQSNFLFIMWKLLKEGKIPG